MLQARAFGAINKPFGAFLGETIAMKLTPNGVLNSEQDHDVNKMTFVQKLFAITYISLISNVIPLFPSA